MKSPLLLTASLTVLLVLPAACSSTDSIADGAAPPTTGEVVATTTEPDRVVTTTTEPVQVPTTTDPLEPHDTSTPTTTARPATAPPTTVPPTTLAPTTLPPTTAVPTTLAPPPPGSPRPTATQHVTIDDGTFDSVADMGGASSLIVLGEVVDITSLGRPFSGSDPNSNEFVTITVRTGDTLQGAPVGEVVLAWQAFATDADGNRTATLLTNGIRPPDVADRLVLFLTPADPATAEFLGGGLTHQLVKLDGIAYLAGDQVVASEVGSTAAEQLLTMTVNDIRAALAS